MFSDPSQTSSGKHMIMDIKEIKNIKLLNDIYKMKEHLDSICVTYDYTILGKLEHKFDPQGFTLLYLLSESHISVHTFPEKNYLALDIYTCRTYNDNTIYKEIYDYLIDILRAKKEDPIIIERKFV